MKLSEAFSHNLYWISPKGKFIKVNGYRHAVAFKHVKKYAKYFTAPEGSWEREGKEHDLYRDVWDDGWIRIRYEKGNFNFQYIYKKTTNKAIQKLVDTVLEHSKSIKVIYGGGGNKQFDSITNTKMGSTVEEFLDAYKRWMR
jgi:hypothetical protein